MCIVTNENRHGDIKDDQIGFESQSGVNESPSIKNGVENCVMRFQDRSNPLQRKGVVVGNQYPGTLAHVRQIIMSVS